MLHLRRTDDYFFFPLALKEKCQAADYCSEKNYGMNPFDWAVAGVAIVGSHQKPLYTKCFFAREEVEMLPAPMVQAHLYTGPDDELQIHFLMHAALDLLAEKAASRCALAAAASPQAVSAATSSTSSSGDPSAAGAAATSNGAALRTSGAGDVRFLDKLIEEGNLSIHGFQSASGIRVLLAVVGDAPRDAVLPLCRSTYEAASAALCNPFLTVGVVGGDGLGGGGLEASSKFVAMVANTLGPFSVTSRSARSV